MSSYNTHISTEHKSSHARSETSPIPCTKINMATHQHFKLRFLLTILKLLHALFYTSYIISTHARPTDDSHYPNTCRLYNVSSVSSNTMLLTRYYAPSTANPVADLTQTHCEDSNIRCLPHKIYRRQLQLQAGLQHYPTTRLHREENITLGPQIEEPGNILGRPDRMRDIAKGKLDRYRAGAGKTPFPNTDVEQIVKTELQKAEEAKIQAAHKPAAAQPRRKPTSKRCLPQEDKRQPQPGTGLRHCSTSSLQNRKDRAVCKVAEPHQVRSLKLKTMVVLIYGICSNRNKITSDTRITAAPTTNEEKWTTNNDKEESYLKACCPCTPRLASVPGERQQNAQVTKLRRSRNYHPMSNTTEAIIS